LKELHVCGIDKLIPSPYARSLTIRASRQISPEPAAPTGLIERKENRFTLESARFILSLTFNEEAERRVHELLTKNPEGRISPDEKEDLDYLVKANTHLSTLQSRARLFLKKAGRQS
jgi:hypothetical protein